MNLFRAKLALAETAEFLEKQQILVSAAAATRDAHMCSRPETSSSSCCGLGSRRSFSNKIRQNPQIPADLSSLRRRALHRAAATGGGGTPAQSEAGERRRDV